MLARATARRQALRLTNHAAEQIQLPWLCPALARLNTVTTQRRTTTSRPVSKLLPRNQSIQARGLATAAPINEDFDSGDEYLPFAYEKHHAALYDTKDSLSQLPLSQLLFLDNTTTLAAERLDTHAHIDVRGNSLEIEATLDACLQVQQWDRAFTLLGQLRRMYASNLSKLQEAYNRVLEAMVFDLIWNRNDQNTDKINEWVEVEMRKAGIDPNAQTFALKIKVALATLQGARRDRTVRRYWEMAKQYQFENQVASLRNILTDSDLGKLTEICPLKIDFELYDEQMVEDAVADHTDAQENTLSSPILQEAVREMEQKGLGLVSLKRALHLFSDPKEANSISRQVGETPEQAVTRFRQHKLERDSLTAAMDRWRVEHEKRVKMGVSGNLSQGKIGALLWQWHELMAEKIKEELQLVKEAEHATKASAEIRNRLEYGPFLRLLEPNQMAAVTALTIIQLMSRAGITTPIRVSRLVTQVGRTIEAEIEAQRTRDQKTQKRAARQKSKVEAEDQAAQHGAIAADKSKPMLHKSGIHDRGLRWSLSLHAKVGAILCELFMDVAKMKVTKEDPESGKSITLDRPMLEQQLVCRVGRKVGVVFAHESLHHMMIKQPAGDLIAKQLPMVSKPKPWTGFTEGGYLESAQKVLRVKFDDTHQQDYTKAAAARGDLDKMYAGLDVLGSTAWRINKNVFNVMLEAWNSGEAVANLPPINKVFPDIPKPQQDATPNEKWKYYKQMRLHENERSGLHSNRCFQNFQMEVARAYLNETFYLPHNVDFRGRAYPIPPYLNQMGADNARGLLMFAEGRELGTDGLKWLQIQLANVFGYDKASLSDRAQFTIDHLDDIRDSVDNPLNGRRWWLEAEDPWQCLAACHEVKNAMDLDDPTKFVSHMPVHQDGSCNGLQHYAALGGDVAGARQVNLEPSDKPADVYTGVAELVKAEIKQDVADGVEIAMLLDGRITRKIVKQTVMTNVYGVTFTGAIRQVRRQVNDILPDLNATGKAGIASIYIARKIFKGLGKLFEGAHDIQYWLGDCAQRISHSISPAQLKLINDREFCNKIDVKVKGIDVKLASRNFRTPRKSAPNTIGPSDFRSTVIWTTPLNLPVVQPYRIHGAQTIQLKSQSLKLLEPTLADAVDPRKQLQAFPPNFIHSLDATHMMLSALKAREIGLQFSAVHDSFWTHAADVNRLNILLREAFIRMHSEDIVGRLAAEFRARYNGHFYLAKIKKTGPLGNRILKYRQDLRNADKKAKKGVQYGTIDSKRYNELVREIKRSRLLASSDPNERIEGEAMITAATIFAEYNGEEHLTSKVSLGQTAIGDASEVDDEAAPEILAEAMQSDPAYYDIDMQSTLGPLVTPDSDEHIDTTSESKEESKEEIAKREAAMLKAESRAKREQKEQIWLWLPLTFKDVPKKGEFDVRRLRDSTYFFS